MTKARSKCRANRSFPRSSPWQIKDPEHKARSYLHESDEQRTGKSTNVKLARRCQFRCCFSIRFFHCSTSCSNTRFKALGNNIRKQIDFFMYIFYGRIFFLFILSRFSRPFEISIAATKEFGIFLFHCNHSLELSCTRIC